MPLTYKINVLDSLKEKGYNTNVLRKEKLISEGTLTKLRNNDTNISLKTIEILCQLLECQPADIIEFRK